MVTETLDGMITHRHRRDLRIGLAGNRNRSRDAMEAAGFLEAAGRAMAVVAEEAV